MRNIAFYLMAFMAGAAVIEGSSTALQLLPFAIYLILAALEIWGKKNFDKVIIAIAVVMILVNILAISFIDVLVWALVLAAHINSLRLETGGKYE